MLFEPYDLTLNTMKVSERKEWSKLVLRQIEDLEWIDLKLTFMLDQNIGNT